MCRAGPLPSLGCMSHSFAGPATSTPHFRHFTKGSHLVLGRSQSADMRREDWLLLLGSGSLCGNILGGVFLTSGAADCHVPAIALGWYINVSELEH